MSKVYLVQRSGIFWQGVFGVFESLNKAIKYAEELKRNDTDDYHDFIVSEVALNHDDSMPPIKWNNYKEPARDLFQTPKREQSK